jgi:hypothetical protein
MGLWNWSKRTKHRLEARGRDGPKPSRLLLGRSVSTSTQSSDAALHPDPSLVDGRNAPVDFDPSYAVVYRDFVSPREAEILAQDILARMKR